MFKDNSSVERDCLEPKEGFLSYWIPFLRWTKSSPQQLKDAEEEFLKYLKTPSEGFHVNIGDINGSPCKIWTRIYQSTNCSTSGPPLVMMHGMGAGSALWANNIDTICSEQQRPVITIDLPGFARSSRCNFSSDPDETETQLVLCIEEWRKKLNLGKIILLGHSFGGYLATSYALKYPEYLEKLLLVDPWGMNQKPSDIVEKYNVSFGVRMLFKVVKRLNPLSGLRALGPLGPRLIPRFRQDMVDKFTSLVGEDNSGIVPSYIYHCNAHNPTGEAAFHGLCDDFFWSKSPMLPRLRDLRKDLKVTFIYGADSWIYQVTYDDLSENVGNDHAINIITIEDARHHVYADQYEEFNSIIIKSIKKL